MPSSSGAVKGCGGDKVPQRPWPTTPQSVTVELKRGRLDQPHGVRDERERREAHAHPVATAKPAAKRATLRHRSCGSGRCAHRSTASGSALQPMSVYGMERPSLIQSPLAWSSEVTPLHETGNSPGSRSVSSAQGQAHRCVHFSLRRAPLGRGVALNAIDGPLDSGRTGVAA